ncbi:hypothetical protein A2662_01625 [Candidatus Giovannonibacteria bacterium RIFCSPHIGHO2_01_FULL_45_33]|uniref:Acetyl-CoA acetyltransferase n=1 Tax=Candidatus Giovannonibacteria bacterium RIFCSPLOWO2_01_FULL_45_34 TaxID=1798351 RepID=A0A1F5X0K4_9BACT|nr:MAG: hypothetical protein A2662_01625 [Candidatus Giovannonibacteria bacterium RIFCSPHIGHO2_01_FULL_45_33]OGF70728.1 MAG: hypothetical protein A3C73_03085 [Candidatus Giovannonibacteria bacterium RIFCSPHIGHO2_02_FULL_44_11]OGF81422.1 MAG: hypothetical protein A2930_01340 [Candidatus Giovannonibacteria bacterium RIFCSPLOWO2_01_FULL_45_34]
MAKARKNGSFIIAAKRLPIGKRRGMFKSFSAENLASVLIRNIIRIDHGYIDDTIIGHYGGAFETPTGVLRLKQNPAKQAVTEAGFGSLSAFTLNKVCSSGLRSVMLADSMIRAGHARCVLAGGMESLSGFSKENILALLRDPFNGYMTYEAGEWCAKRFGIGREEQDDWAIKSYKRARFAVNNNFFEEEILDFNGMDKDEEPLIGPDEKYILSDKTFVDGGTITASNASKNADGAAMCLVANETIAKMPGLQPLGRILGHASYAHRGDTKSFTIAPPFAMRLAAQDAGLKIDDIDFIEINAAFASVALYAIHKLKLDCLRVNFHGDAISFGHPIGATGTILLVKTLYLLKNSGGRYGIVCLCNAGGEATAMVVENIKYL